MKTHGTARLVDGLEGKRWLIQVTPHVMLRLKRVFSRIKKSQLGCVELSDTPENSRELLWFAERFPLEIRPRNYIEQRAKEHLEWEALVESVLSPNYKPPEFKLALPPRDYQRLGADLALRSGALLVADEVGLGKAQPIDSCVLTPSGWRPIGMLRIGDEVIDPEDGSTAHVTGVFPRGVRECFRVTTADGASAECCDEHLWEVESHNDRVRGTRRVLPLAELRLSLFQMKGSNRTSKYFLPLAAPPKFQSAGHLPLHPYLLGVLLGDGCFKERCVGLTSADPEVIEAVRSMLPSDVRLAHSENYDYRLSGTNRTGIKNSVLHALRVLGIANKRAWDKSIPDAYLRAGIEDRLSLLRGLMDTDGSCRRDGTSTFTSTSERLSSQTRELVCSLGGFASLSSRVTNYDYKGERRHGRRSYTLNIRISVNPFQLKRKADRWHKPYMARAIRSVEPVGEKETVCISVSTKRSLYVTDGYLVTHNTVIGIAMMSDRRTLPALVVTMTHLPTQWEREINRFLPGLNVRILKTGIPVDLTKGPRGKVLPFPDVIIANYHKLSGWGETLAKFVKLVIFDEAQELRIPSSAKYQAAQFLAHQVPYRLMLSATPIYNYGNEIHSVLSVIKSDALGTRHEFEREWCTGETGDSEQTRRGVRVRDPRALGIHLREQGLMIRRTRPEVGREIPKVESIPVEIESDLEALDKIQNSATELAKIILAQGGQARGAQLHASEQFSNLLRQATGIAKAPYVANFTRMLAEAGEKVVLFGWHREVYAIWLRVLYDLNPVLYTGSESTPQKDANKRAFCEGASQVMIISNRSGAGLDGLQFVSRICVIGELDWSPLVQEQNIGRIARDGQTHPVAAYIPLAQTGSDPIIADILGLKRAQATSIVDPHAPLVAPAQTDPGRIRKLAEAYLAQRREVA